MGKHIVKCLCDSCGRTGTCGEKAKAPKGWFFYELTDPDGTGETYGTALACSDECKLLPWKKRTR